MIIYVEGCRCSGKTTLIEGLRDPPAVKVLRAVGKDGAGGSPDVFMRHDESKCAVARSQPTDRLVLVDRGYLSTVLFYTVKQEVDPGFSAWPIYEWLLRGLGSSLSRPDHYVFVDTPLDVCLARARQARRTNPDDMWLAAPERMAGWYHRLFAAFEHNVPLHTLDGRGTQDEVLDRFTALVGRLFAIPRSAADEVS